MGDAARLVPGNIYYSVWFKESDSENPIIDAMVYLGTGLLGLHNEHCFHDYSTWPGGAPLEEKIQDEAVHVIDTDLLGGLMTLRELQCYLSDMIR